MQTKPLLYGLIGFFIGGFIVSLAATTFDKPATRKTAENDSSMSSKSMDDMTTELKNKTGDAYDRAFIVSMIAHHEGAVEMAQLSAANAKHEEIKELSKVIIAAQAAEIDQMKQWLKDWGYAAGGTSQHNAH